MEVIRGGKEGQPVLLDIMRANTNTVEKLSLTPRPTLQADRAVPGPLSLGLPLAPNFLRTDYVLATSFPNALSLSLRTTSQTTYDISSSLLSVLKSTFLTKNSSQQAALSGPVGLIRAGSSVVSTRDVHALVFFVSTVSINLAVVNSLPIPGLDGGQLAFLFAGEFWETRNEGKKIDPRSQDEINALALLFLLALSFSATVGDVKDLIGKR